jgi:hypothetical protein
VSSMVAYQRVAMLALQVEVPTASPSANTPDPAVGEECLKTGPEVAGARSMYLVAARI